MRIENEVLLDYSDVLIRPKRSTLGSRKEVNLEREFTFRNYTLIIYWFQHYFYLKTKISYLKQLLLTDISKMFHQKKIIDKTIAKTNPMKKIKATGQKT